MENKTTLQMVKEFHKTFNHPVKGEYDISDKELNKLRLKLLREEVNELELALENGDILATLDALTDIQYVLDGAYLAFGLQKLKEVAFKEIHRSNMSKLDRNGFPIYREDGKILKGENYIAPDLKQFF